MGSYTVDRPPGEGWKVVTANEERIVFSRNTMGDDGSVLLTEGILVKTQWAKAKNIWKLQKNISKGRDLAWSGVFHLASWI